MCAIFSVKSIPDLWRHCRRSKSVCFSLIITRVDLPSHQDGQPFNRVAQEYSEDKAKGVLHYCRILSAIHFRHSWWQSWLDGERKYGWTLPRRSICSYTIYGWQTYCVWPCQNKFWVPYHYGRRASLSYGCIRALLITPLMIYADFIVNATFSSWNLGLAVIHCSLWMGHYLKYKRPFVCTRLDRFSSPC